MFWDTDFAGLPPIELPDGRKLETLADLRGYILALPKQERLRWSDAVAVLLLLSTAGLIVSSHGWRSHGLCTAYRALNPLRRQR